MGCLLCDGCSAYRCLAGLASTHSRSYGRERVYVLELLRASEYHPVVRETACHVSTVARSTCNGGCWRRLYHEFRSVSPISLGTFSPLFNEYPCRTPIELVKCKMQVQMLMAPGVSPAQAAALSAAPPATALPTATSGAVPHKLPGPISVLMSVLRESGVRGLWLGQTATLIRETGGGAAWFASKEAVATLLLASRGVAAHDKRELHAWESAISGAAAGVAYNVALFPADTVKSAMQTEAELRPRARGEPGPTFVGTFRAMYAAQGMKGLYAGCGITVARAVPSSALIFLIYDGLSKRYSSP